MPEPIVCPEASYAAPLTGTCFACPPQCLACSNPDGSCTSCIPGHELHAVAELNQCQQCAAGTLGAGGLLECVDCPDGTYTPFHGSTSCMACPAQCAPGECDKITGACTHCPAGQRLVGGMCVPCINPTWSPGGITAFCPPCIPNCLYCGQTDGVCTQCSPGHAPPDCLACANGMWTHGTDTCATCAEECTACSITDGACTQCIEDYTLSDGRCVPTCPLS